MNGQIGGGRRAARRQFHILALPIKSNLRPQLHFSVTKNCERLVDEFLLSRQSVPSPYRHRLTCTIMGPPLYFVNCPAAAKAPLQTSSLPPA